MTLGTHPQHIVRTFTGLAAFHSDYPMVMRLANLVKAKLSETILLVGNAHSTIDPQDFIFENYSRPGYVVDKQMIYPTIPGTNFRDYSRPGYKIE